MGSQSDAASEELAAGHGEPPLPQRSRSEVVRDVLIFQLKLFVDGLRDVILSPISLLLGLVGAFVSRDPGEPFYRLLRAGRASEQWIDLFGAAYPDDREPVEPSERAQQIQKEFEEHLHGLETSLRSADYDQAARDNAARLKALWKRHASPADAADCNEDVPPGNTSSNDKEK